MVSLKEQFNLISDLIKNANAEIKKHNDIVIDFTNQRTKLVNAIWKFIIQEIRTEIEKYNSTKSGFEKGIAAIDLQLKNKLKEYQDLNLEIKKLSKNVTGIKPTIDEINKLLKYYGFTNFEIVPVSEEGYYKIQREDGTMAKVDA